MADEASSTYQSRSGPEHCAQHPSGQSPSDPTPADTVGFRTFWTTLPGVLTGFAAVVTAIVGLIALFNGAGGEGNIDVSDRAATSARTQGEHSDSSFPSGETSKSSALPTDVLRQGYVSMDASEVADLEHGVVGEDPIYGTLYFSCTLDDCYILAYSGLLTRIKGPGSKSECSAVLNPYHHYPPLDVSDLRPGETLCFKTTLEHIGALHVRAFRREWVEFTFFYTLWR